MASNGDLLCSNEPRGSILWWQLSEFFIVGFADFLLLLIRETIKL